MLGEVVKLLKYDSDKPVLTQAAILYVHSWMCAAYTLPSILWERGTPGNLEPGLRDCDFFRDWNFTRTSSPPMKPFPAGL